MSNQAFPPPAPPPPHPSQPSSKQQLDNTKSPPNPNRRQLFSNRMRTGSSGSTRNAFGLLPVDASAHNPEDIYQRQQEAMQKGRHVHINNGAAASTARTGGNGYGSNKQGDDNNHRSNGRRTATATSAEGTAHASKDASAGHNDIPSKSRKKQRQGALATPGQTIDEEWGSTKNNDNMNVNVIGGGSSSSGGGGGGGTNSGTGKYGGIGLSIRTNDPSSLSSSYTNNHSYSNTQMTDPSRNHSNGTETTTTNTTVDSASNMNMHNVYASWSNLPQPPSQYSNNQALRYNSNDTLVYSYPTIGGSSRTSDMDMYFMQSGGVPPAGNNPTMATGEKGGYEDKGSGDHGDGVGGAKSVDSESTYSSGYEPEQLTWFQYLIYHHAEPEFTSVQQSVWAVFIGIAMGLFTAIWGEIIEWCVEFTWKTVPEYLLEKGIFTDLDGYLPLPYYMVICPAIFGGLLSYFTAAMTTPKVPGQNEWIESLHRVGIMDHTMFFPVIIFSTLGMASGLSLGPEMPLVLSAGMIGSMVAVMCKQSVLSARVMNLTAASAGIGGFFGLPMAGALFVLELPHRMGLQYFEAVSPAILASIVSVIVNRMITENEVKGMFKYPFLSESLPSNIFWVVIIYGIAGSFVGAVYAEGLLWLKHWVHDWFHAPHDDHHDGHDSDHLKLEPHHNVGESMPLMVGMGNSVLHMHKKPKESCCTWMQKGVQRFFGIEHEPTRAGVAGILVGLIVGYFCMLLPHLLFWGEAQLQTMIDRGMTPLPVFGYDDEPTALLTAYGYCLVDPNDERDAVKGFSASCCGIIALTKIFVVGISLGTGVCGGHFWAPLFVGCAASHFFTDMMAYVSEYVGFGSQISAYPCLAVICIMGSTHVVTFRAQMAIILVLTLSINSFASGEKLHSVQGDYSAIFPLLVVACYIPLLLTRNVIFYAKQVCRGDITAIPEVLCEPHKAGTAQIYRIDNLDDVTNSSGSAFGPEYDDEEEDDLSVDDSEDASDDISLGPEQDYSKNSIVTPRTEDTSFNSPEGDTSKSTANVKNGSTDMLSSSMHSTRSSSSRRSRMSTSSRPSLARVRSKGKIDDSNYQKPLLHQSREGASTAMKKKDGPKLPRVHKRTKSGASWTDLSPPKADLDQSRH